MPRANTKREKNSEAGGQTSELRTPTSEQKPPEVPTLPDTREAQRVEGRLLEVRRDYGEDTELRLRALYAIWRNPLLPKSLTSRQQDELVRFDIVRNEIQKPINNGIALQCSMQDMAAYLTKKYGAESNTGSQKIYYPPEISKYCKRGAPKPGRNKKLNSQDFLRWFEENILGRDETGEVGTGTIAAGEAAKNRRQVILEERDRFQLDLEKKKAAGELVSQSQEAVRKQG